METILFSQIFLTKREQHNVPYSGRKMKRNTIPLIFFLVYRTITAQTGGDPGRPQP